MSAQTQDTALLEAILDAAVDAMVVADARGTILRANPAADQLFGYPIGALANLNIDVLMPSEVAKMHDTFVAQHLSSGENRIIGKGREIEGRRADGSLFPLHISVGKTVVDGQHLFVAIMRDLTVQQTTQAALARSQRLDAIGRMTGGIAHDFNNLLTVVIGNLELLETRDPTDRQLDLINDALSSAEMGAELTSRLMVFARQSDLRPVASDLRVLCKEALAILRRTLGAQITVQTDFAAHVHPVLIDPIQLQSALMNIALNARDAMDAGGELLVSIGDVTIDDDYMAQETDMQPGQYVRLSISDDGAGMSPEAQRRAFEPFFTTKQNSGGTGLGLATVYGFVRQSGGHITLYSEPGHGTSFGLYFPAIPAKDGVEETDARPRAERVQGHVGRGESVLVVEDNPKVRALSVDRIRDLGFTPHEAASGDEAYRMLCDGLQVDILFSDLVMPGTLNGYDLAEKTAKEFPQIKVLLTSGYASDVVTDRMAHGIQYEILHKPYRQSDLAGRLQLLLTASPGP